MEFSHTGDKGLFVFGIVMDLEGRVFFAQSAEGFAKFFSLGAILWFDADGDYGFGEVDILEQDRIFFLAEGMACFGVF